MRAQPFKHQLLVCLIFLSFAIPAHSATFAKRIVQGGVNRFLALAPDGAFFIGAEKRIEMETETDADLIIVKANSMGSPIVRKRFRIKLPFGHPAFALNPDGGITIAISVLTFDNESPFDMMIIQLSPA